MQYLLLKIQDFTFLDKLLRIEIHINGLEMEFHCGCVYGNHGEKALI